MSFPYYCDGSPDGKGVHWIRGSRCERCGFSMPPGEPTTRAMLILDAPPAIEPTTPDEPSNDTT